MWETRQANTLRGIETPCSPGKNRRFGRIYSRKRSRTPASFRVLLLVFACLTLQPWWWRRYYRPKCLAISKIHGVVNQKTCLLFVITWNPTERELGALFSRFCVKFRCISVRSQNPCCRPLLLCFFWISLYIDLFINRRIINSSARKYICDKSN
jgi:hypothetical protein